MASKVAPGTKLRRWTVGRKLGSGAFGDVYNAVDATGSEYAVKVVHMPKTKRKGKKSKQSMAAALLFKERNFYHNLFRAGHPSLVTVPKDGYFEQDGLRCLVMTKLGDTLSAALAEHGPFAPANLALVATQIIDFLQFVHTNKYVYRDIKPDNFMLGGPDAPHRVFAIDLGAAEREFMHNGSRQAANENGTPTYMSLNTHNAEAPSPRDDLEGMGYMLVKLATGSLPWEQAKSAPELLASKRGTSVAALCSDCPAAVRTFLETVRRLGIDDSINYAALQAVFAPLVPTSCRFDWAATASADAGAGSGAVDGAGAAPTRRRRAAKRKAPTRRTKAAAKVEAEVEVEVESPEPAPQRTARTARATRSTRATAAKRTRAAPRRAATRGTAARRRGAAAAEEALVVDSDSDSDSDVVEVAAPAPAPAPRRRRAPTRRRRAAAVATATPSPAPVPLLSTPEEPTPPPRRSGRKRRQQRAPAPLSSSESDDDLRDVSDASDPATPLDRVVRRRVGAGASASSVSPDTPLPSPVVGVRATRRSTRKGRKVVVTAAAPLDDDDIAKSGVSDEDVSEDNASVSDASSSGSDDGVTLRRSRRQVLMDVGTALAGGVLGAIGSVVLHSMSANAV